MTHLEMLSEDEGVLLLHRHKGLLQRVARRCGVHPSLVSRVFHGKARSKRVEKELGKALFKLGEAAVRLGKPRTRPTAPNDRIHEFRWIADHRQEYAGQWIALDGYRLVAHGPHAKEVVVAAGRSGRSPLIHHIEPPDAPLFGGW